MTAGSPSSSLKLTNPQGSKCGAEQGALYVENLCSLEIINTNTQKRVGYYTVIILPFLTDVATLLIVEWHLEEWEKTAVSASPHITVWVGCWCYHSSAFWCLRGKDVETFYDLSTHGQSLRIWALSAQMHVKIPEINLMIYKEVQIGC